MMNCFWQSISKLGKIKKVGTLFLKIRQLSAILILFCFVAHGEMFDFKHEQRMSNSWFKHDYLHFFSKSKPCVEWMIKQSLSNSIQKRFTKDFLEKNAYFMLTYLFLTLEVYRCSKFDVTKL